MQVPDADDASRRKTDDVLVDLVDDDVDDGEEMSDELADRPGEDVRMPDAQQLVDAAGDDDVRRGAVVERVDALLDGETSNRPVRGSIDRRTDKFQILSLDCVSLNRLF